MRCCHGPLLQDRWRLFVVLPPARTNTYMHIINFQLPASNFQIPHRIEAVELMMLCCNKKDPCSPSFYLVGTRVKNNLSERKTTDEDVIYGEEEGRCPVRSSFVRGAPIDDVAPRAPPPPHPPHEILGRADERFGRVPIGIGRILSRTMKRQATSPGGRVSPDAGRGGRPRVARPRTGGYDVPDL